MTKGQMRGLDMTLELSLGQYDPPFEKNTVSFKQIHTASARKGVFVWGGLWRHADDIQTCCFYHKRLVIDKLMYHCYILKNLRGSILGLPAHHNYDK